MNSIWKIIEDQNNTTTSVMEIPGSGCIVRVNQPGVVPSMVFIPGVKESQLPHPKESMTERLHHEQVDSNLFIQSHLRRA